MRPNRLRLALSAWLLTLALCAPAAAFAAGAQNPPAASPPVVTPAPPVTAPPTADEIERRAFLFFWDESDPATGLTKDRAVNIGLTPGAPDTHTVGSIASTGYALAALPIGVEHGWVKYTDAYDRARTTLRYLQDRLPNNHGFYFHFVDWKTGERVWKCELSSIDSALLVLGALECGQYFKGTEVQRLAGALYDRMDWRWMRKGGLPETVSPAPPSLSMGWKPETGWLPSRWSSYNEATYLYLMAMGAPDAHNLPPSAWTSWNVKPATQEGYSVLGEPGPLFMAQMCPAYFDLRGLVDARGYDWWQSFANVHRAHVAYCHRNEDAYKTFAGGVFGITASDRPDGYGANDPVDGRQDGTIAPSAFLAGILFVPEASQTALRTLWARPERDSFWGRYGFSNALNVDKNWYDRDVIGIDLGMTLLSLEDQRNGLPWRLIRSAPMYDRALRAAGMHPGTGYPPGDASGGGTSGTARVRSSARG